MSAERYKQQLVAELPDRSWPSRVLTQAPLWCSVDLRDGNQALPAPMDASRKAYLFDLLIAMGLKEIEVGYPSASQDDFDFVRNLIERRRIPPDVTISVFTPARPELIERTFEALRGVKRAMVHLCCATAPLWREVVFGTDRAGVVEMTTKAALLVVELAEAMPGSDIRFEYSPETFNLTEPDFALEICNRMIELWDARPERPVTINLPSTVETTTPNLYADQIEWMHRRLARRDNVILSVHPHNDRGTAVASAEVALLAGADRVEGCLFGNGERTGNVCLATLALNLFSTGVDPEIDLSDIDGIRRVVEHCTRMPVPARHPYVGEYVYTAFSGTHQDAINKGLRALRTTVDRLGRTPDTVAWQVPYLPIDPRDVGRDYESVVRVNSQSGKGGVAYLLASHYKLHLPRGLQVELSQLVQTHTDAHGGELTSKDLWALFSREFLRRSLDPLRLLRLTPASGGRRTRPATVSTPQGQLDCALPAGDVVPELVARLRERGYPVSLGERGGHTIDNGGRISTVAYVEVLVDGTATWGAGLAPRADVAAAQALLSAVNRSQPAGRTGRKVHPAAGVREPEVAATVTDRFESGMTR